ncbi:hypothetical protein, partial [Nitrospira sp. BLG_2]|uniref:hypothetical protein n=1 Tax=Nitrospira sp. BLG_2 TaxID=3397507 RepID=UPI003B99B4B0
MPDSVSPFTLVDVPGSVPLLGHLPRFKKRPLETMAGWWRQYGDALRFRLGPKTLHLFSHPDLAEAPRRRDLALMLKALPPVIGVV